MVTPEKTAPSLVERLRDVARDMEQRFPHLWSRYGAALTSLDTDAERLAGEVREATKMQWIKYEPGKAPKQETASARYIPPEEALAWADRIAPQQRNTRKEG